MNNLNDFRYPEWNEDFEGMIPNNPIPTPTAEDEGKVLSVDSSGEYALGNVGLPDWSNGEEDMVLMLRYAPIVLVEAQTVTIEDNEGQMTHGFDATGFEDGKTEAYVTIDGREVYLYWDATNSCFKYTDGRPYYYFYANGYMTVVPAAGRASGQYTISDLTTTWGSTSLVPTWIR
jgi:hypothetical protein